MNSETTYPSSIIDIPAVTPNPGSAPRRAKTGGRCSHRFPNGKQCRKYAIASHFGLCPQHFEESAAIGASLQQDQSDFTDLSADLLPELSEFSSGDDIRKFLSRLLVLVTKGRTSPRRAAVLGYITNQLLHSHRAIARESIPPVEEITQVIPDIPGQGREWAQNLYPADDSRPARKRVPCYWTIPLPDDASVRSPVVAPPAANPGTNSHPEKPPS